MSITVVYDRGGQAQRETIDRPYSFELFLRSLLARAERVTLEAALAEATRWATSPHTARQEQALFLRIELLALQGYYGEALVFVAEDASGVEALTAWLQS
jgi:hypothetical protein